MTKLSFAVANDMVVGIAYKLRLEDGDVIDDAPESEPFEFIQGHGNIIRGLEEALYGLKVGDEREIRVSPADGYGAPDPEAFVIVPLQSFPVDMELTEGMTLSMRDKDSDEVVEAYVTEIRDEGVLMDLNHPLAGETLFFDVEVVSLRPASPSELAHGHVHSSHHNS
ncbi:MAG: peptidylprolyl isomerase [Candidatus Promineifilaceae bacterium]|jgi:FKBP-type peptidyl-prolyl cis-trans isomerase SlyD